MDPSYLNLASKVFVSDKYSLNTDFSKSARSLNVDVGSIDFTHPKTAAETINEWVSTHIFFVSFTLYPERSRRNREPRNLVLRHSALLIE